MKNKQSIGCTMCVSNKGQCTEQCLPVDWELTPADSYAKYYKHFELTESQAKKLRAWERAKPEKHLGTIGGGLTVSFTITGIGYFVTAKSWDGTEINLTEYDKL